MSTDKRSRATYWTATLLFAVPMVLGGLAELGGAKQAIMVMKELGYPLYLLAFLGLAKLLGVAAIVTNRYPRLKEWAYAGFTFDLLGASYSHLAMGQAKAALGPIVIGLIGAASYVLWRRQEGREGAVTSQPGSRDRRSAVVERKKAV